MAFSFLAFRTLLPVGDVAASNATLLCVGFLSCFSLILLLRHKRSRAWHGGRRAWFFSVLVVKLLLRGTIVNRTYGIHKNPYIEPFLLTIFGPINYGPP